MTSGHLQYVIRIARAISLMAKAHFQYVIKYLGKLAPQQRSDRYPPLVCHQVSQEWFNDKEVIEYLPFSMSSILAKTLIR